MSFMETISLLPEATARRLSQDRTILFYAMDESWEYARPDALIDPFWGVICFPENFHGIARPEHCQLRVTNAASYERWHRLAHTAYSQAKEDCVARSRQVVSKIVGNYGGDIVYQDSFTPLTIERYTAKDGGAVYGSPTKIRDGRTPFGNLYVAGTDQGFLGIVFSAVKRHLSFRREPRAIRSPGHYCQQSDWLLSGGR